jgi:phenylpropionate dioxygenase-like ring-hydroxylating dioxygenase large terminal subunit
MNHMANINQQTDALPMAGSRYYSPAFAAREWAAVWTRTWLLLCRADDVPEPGDFLVEEIGPESILVVRQEDGAIRAFYNVCQHRGNRLVMGAEGSLAAFTCAYHGWRWALDGTCVRVQDEEDFPAGSPCGRKVLAPVHCEVFASFVWINMSDDPEPLKDYLGPLYSSLEAYPFDAMTRTQAISIRMPCNWKIISDNFRETYHIPTAHPEALYINDPDYTISEIETLDRGHGFLRTPGNRPSKYLPGGKQVMDHYLIADLKNWGLDPDAYVGRETEIRKDIQRQKRLLGPERGLKHYDRLCDDQLTDTLLYSVFPNVGVICFADSILLVRAFPHATDPEKCVFDCFNYASGADDVFTKTTTATYGCAEASGGPAPREWRNFGEGSLGVILDGDAGIMEAQQRGVRSRGYRGAELSGQERRVVQYHDYIDKLIAEYEAGLSR